MEEIAGDDAVYVDPRDVESIRDGHRARRSDRRRGASQRGPRSAAATARASTRQRRVIRCRRRRARPQPHRRGDIRRSTCCGSCRSSRPTCGSPRSRDTRSSCPTASRRSSCPRASRSCAWRGRCRGCCGGCARARALPARAAARLARPGVVTMHDLHFEHDPVGDGLRRPADVQGGRAARRPPGRPRARGVGADEARRRRPLRHPAGEGRPSRRTASTRRSARARRDTAATCSSSARCRRARTRSPRSRRPRRSGCRSSSSGRRRSPSWRVRCERGGADVRGWVAQDELAELYRGAAALILPSRLRGLRRAGARGDGERHAGRALRRPGAARGRRRRGRLRATATSEARRSARSPNAAATSQPGSSARELHLGGDRAADGRGLSGGARVRVAAVVVSHGHAARARGVVAGAARRRSTSSS